jgi:hypothetical protein
MRPATEILAACIAILMMATLVAMVVLRIVFWRRLMREGHSFFAADGVHYSRAQSDAVRGDRLARLYLRSINLTLVLVAAFFVFKFAVWTVSAS